MKILIIEEEKLLAESIKALLLAKGFKVDAVCDGKTGVEYALLGLYDLLIVDVAVRGIDSCKVTKRIREQHCGTPILTLTDIDDVKERISILNAGADLFLQKPFDSQELMACVNALLRRQGSQTDEMSYGNTTLDLSACMLRCGEKSIRLSAREFDVMRAFMQSKDRIISKEVILARVWGYDSNAVDNHVEVYVGFLRKKLKSIGSDVQIIALRRLGYHLEIEKEAV